MWLQLLLISIAFIYWKNWQYSDENPKYVHKYVTLLIIMLILQSGLRHVAVGADTYAYYLKFEDVHSKSWSWVLQNFYDVYILGDGKDAGYPLIQKIFQILFPVFRLFLIAVAIAFFIPFYRFVEKELMSIKMLFFSFCIYQALYYSFFSITGLRQTLATVATIVSMKYIMEKRFYKFLCVILLGALVHKSVLIFLPFYFLANFKKSKTLLFASIASLPLIMQIARPLAIFMASHSGSAEYMMYAESDFETQGATNFMIYIVITGLITLYAKMQSVDEIPNYLVNAVSLAIVFTPLTWVDPSLMRVVQYYSIFSIIALPISIRNLKLSRSSINVIFVFMIFILLFTIFRRNYEYAFFFQHMDFVDGYSIDTII